MLNTVSFDGLKEIDTRLAKIDHRSADILCSFYDENLASFSVQPGVQRFSVTSTCFALRAILASKDSFSDRICFDLGDRAEFSTEVEGVGNEIPLRSIVKALLYTEWREEDLFQVPLVVETVLMIDRDLNRYQVKVLEKATAFKINRLVVALLNTRPMRRSGRTQPLSDYLQFRSAQALLGLSRALYHVTPGLAENECSICIGGLGNLPISELPSNVMKDVSFALAR